MQALALVMGVMLLAAPGVSKKPTVQETPPTEQSQQQLSHQQENASKQTSEAVADQSTDHQEQQQMVNHEEDTPQQQAYFLHADALVAEITQEFSKAIDLLKKARELDPESKEVAFDLARMVTLYSTSESELQAVKGINVDDEAANDLYDALAAKLAADHNRPFRLLNGMISSRLRLGVSVDTNVALAPGQDVTFESSDRTPVAPDAYNVDPMMGVRMVSEGQIAFSPLQGFLNLDVAGMFRLGSFVNEGGGETYLDGELTTPSMELYDSQMVSLVGMFSVDLKFMRVNATWLTSEVFYQNFDKQFMQGTDFVAEVLFGSKGDYFGVYGGVGYWDFVDGNQEGTPEDRDTANIDAGFLFAVNTDGYVGFHIRAGGIRELADGTLMRVWGGFASTTMTLNIGPVRGAVGISDEVRAYVNISPSAWNEITDMRVDNLVNPFARFQVKVWDYISIYGAYRYTYNFSTHDENIIPRQADGPVHYDRTYQRHFMEFGVEGHI